MFNRLLYIVLGLSFGFVLSRAGATNPEYYAKLFLLEDLQLMWVMGVAAVLGILGIALMKRTKVMTVIGSNAIAYKGKPWKKGLIVGSLLFGAGWGLSAACPGTVLAMLGEGRLTALPVIGGILVGTWLFGVQQSRVTAKKAAGKTVSRSEVATAAPDLNTT